jgi:hypothetical protein
MQPESYQKGSIAQLRRYWWMCLEMTFASLPMRG